MSIYKQTFSLLKRYMIQNVYSFKITETRNIKRWVAPTLKQLKHRRDKIGPEPETPRSNYLEWNYEAELFAFGKRLNEEFEKNLLKQALIQREYANLQEFTAKEKGTEPPEILHNYELIKEGEGIISNYVSTHYKKLYPEDVADAVLQYLTSEDMLSHIASHIGLKDLILTNEFPVSKETLSNTFKAIIAAINHSKDLQQAENFVRDFVIAQMNGKDPYEIWDLKNPYEYLTHLLNSQGVKEIEPRLCNETAVNTILACYQVGLYNNRKLLGIGWGETIEVAKDTAALDAIQRIHKNLKTQ